MSVGQAFQPAPVGYSTTRGVGLSSLSPGIQDKGRLWSTAGLVCYIIKSGSGSMLERSLGSRQAGNRHAER